MSSEGKKKQQRWFPLESNPTLMNEYVSKLGFDTSLYHFVDVFSTEEWALQMIPQPVAAVMVLYPLTETQLKAATNDDAATTAAADVANDIWFTKQRIGNACGTIGLLHAILNAPEPLRSCCMQANSWLMDFQNDCPNRLDPIKKAERLEDDDKIASLHDQATSSSHNQTSRGELQDRVVTHFIALIHMNGKLWELDGRKEGPVDHGPTTPATLLQDACVKVVREKLMKRDPTELRFTILALAPKEAEE